MKRVLFGLFLCGAWCGQVGAADLSPEAVRSFEWFKTLGYPDLTQAPLAEVWTGRHMMRNDHDEIYSELEFVLGDNKDKFTTLTFLLTPETWTKTGTGTPANERVGYGVLDFSKTAAGILKNARQADSGFVSAAIDGHPEWQHYGWSKQGIFFLRSPAMKRARMKWPATFLRRPGNFTHLSKFLMTSSKGIACASPLKWNWPMRLPGRPTE